MIKFGDCPTDCGCPSTKKMDGDDTCPNGGCDGCKQLLKSNYVHTKKTPLGVFFYLTLLLCENNQKIK